MRCANGWHLLALHLWRWCLASPVLRHVFKSCNRWNGCRGPGIPRAMRWQMFMRRSRRHAWRWFLSTRARRLKCFSRNYGRPMRTIWRLRFTMVHSMWPSAARWSRPWRTIVCGRWCARPRWTLALTGAMWIWSFMWVRRKVRRDSCSASGGPITAWMNQATRCWCRPTVLRCSNARPHWRRPKRMPKTPSIPWS